MRLFSFLVHPLRHYRMNLEEVKKEISTNGKEAFQLSLKDRFLGHRVRILGRSINDDEIYDSGR